MVSETVSANWVKNEDPDIQTAYETISGSGMKDSLPDGISKDWLNNLTDENGKRIIPEKDNRNNSRQIPEDPEGDAIQRKVFNGLSVNSSFGMSVSSAGDVNGDGYDDIIVSAPEYSSGTGRAYIFYGGQFMNTIADVTLTGETTFNYFGRSVSSAGDVNGDGYSDVIVGANGYSSKTGRAYIYFGGAVMNNIADVIMTGEATLNFFGNSLSSAGDVNGDGYSDVIVSAYGYSTNQGRVYIFFGGAAMNNTADVVMTGGAANDHFGLSVSNAGDVNGDGYSDIITGTYLYSSLTGRAYIYYGGASMDNIADVTMTGEGANNNFGFSVSSAGDVNGDGYSDVIAGACGYSSDKGRAYIFYGGASMNNVADITMTGEASGNLFGYSVSSAGDVNGDGYSDVISGACGYSSDKGRAYVYFGGLSMNNSTDVTITGETSNDNFGWSVSNAGDVNGDGYSDVLVGAFGYSSNKGRVYLYDYFLKNEIIEDMSVNGDSTGYYFGISVSSAGDVNGDGFSDVIVGAYGFNNATGRAYIYFGGVLPDNTADVIMTGQSTFSYFGSSVSSAGDVNGDGFSDVIVGAYGFNNATGRAYIYFGGASMNNVADVTMTGESANNSFGGSVSSTGDVNGDGFSDVIVGAGGYGSNKGRAYIYFGEASMDNVADLKMTGEAINNSFGGSVSSAGDVNGDGFSDVIAGARLYSANTGRLYVYYGGEFMDNSADVIMTGESANTYLGISVASAGDVNGDGYSDVIAGASYYSSSAGRAYIYFGGASMNNTADVIMNGEAIQNYFGESVATAGDVNGDGYSDVVVGASGYSSGIGKAYIFFGGLSMNNEADVTMKGDNSNNYFGYSVSSAGDINGDGYSDVIAGEYGYLFKGRSNIYFGSEISAKPILNYVRDVPNDQGGKVKLKWSKSSLESLGAGNVSQYVVLRSQPPGINGFEWEQIANLTALNSSFYYYTANTLSDSSSASNGNTFFQIKAVKSSTGEIWSSNIISGRSIDNIAPPAVSPFSAVASGSGVITNWKKSSAPDLLNYVLFRSTVPVIDPYTETPFAITTDSTYLDSSPLSGLYYYFIVAQDIHNNFSPVAVTESPNITVNLTMFIEGFYNSATDLQVSDTIKTTLRSTVSPYNIIGSANAIVSPSGNAVLNFGNAPGGNYYIVIKHRNSIETWSASGIALTTGGSVNYNLSTASSQAFGNNMKQIDSSPVRFGIYSGDQNQNGIVDLTDIVNVSNAASLFTNGYVSTDMNGDNITDLTDIVITSNNASAFVTKITP